MEKLCVINYKGGTGKTSTVINLAHGLALQGRRVLVIDTDPQGSSAQHLGVEPRYGLYDLLMGKASFETCIVHARKDLDIICGNERLFPAEMSMARLKGRELVLSKRLKHLKGYDYVIVDCAPSLNLLNQNALVFSDQVLLPVSMEYLSLVGVKQLLKNITMINRIFKRKLVVTKVVPTFFDQRQKKAKEIMQSLERVFPGRLSTPIRVCVSLSEAPSQKMTIFEYDPNSTGSEDYKTLVNEVIYGKTKGL